MTLIEDNSPKIVVEGPFSIGDVIPIPFPYVETQDVKLKVGEDTLVYNVDYSIYLQSLTIQKDVEDGTLVTVYRDTPLDQQAEFPQNNKFNSAKLNTALDKLTMQQQEQAEQLTRALKLDISSSSTNLTLPNPEAGLTFKWNEDGTALENYDIDADFKAFQAETDAAIKVATDGLAEEVDKAKTELSSEVQSLRADTNQAIDDFKIETNSNIDAFKTETNTNLATFKAETNENIDNFKAETESTIASFRTETNESIDEFKTETNASVADIGSRVDKANETANMALDTANSADMQAEEALTTSEEANKKADSATAAAAAAVTTANAASETATNASTTASGAVTTANTADKKADEAIATANAAKATADTASDTANSAKTTAEGIAATAQSAFDTAADAVSQVETAVTASNEAKEASEAAQKASENVVSTAANALSVASEAKSTADSAKTTAEGIAGTAQNALDTASAANTTASSAQEAASSAKTTAEGIAGTANSALSTASAASNKVDGLATQVETLASDVSTTSSDLSALATEVGGISTNVGSLTTDLGSLTTKVDGISTDVSGLTSDLGTLTTKTNGIATDLGTLTKRVDGHDTDISNLETAIANIKIDSATEEAEGIIRIATEAEAQNGLDNSTAMTPLTTAQVVYENVGRTIQLGFNGTLSDKVLLFEPTDGTTYTIKEGYEYELDLLFEAAGTLDDDINILIKNGDTVMNIVNALHNDPSAAVTVAQMSQVQNYSDEYGFRWIFKGRFVTTADGSYKVFVMPSTVTSLTNSGAAGLPIGAIYPVMCTDDYVPTGALPCNGSEYSQSQFKDLWTNYLVAGLLNTCTYDEYAQDITDYGSCAKFAIDTDNNTFKVPTIKDGTFIQQANSSSALGQSYNAGLPNIEGSIELLGPGSLPLIYSVTEGALYNNFSTKSYSGYSGGGTVTRSTDTFIRFDASLSNPIYGNSDTVQPQAVALRYFVQVANGQINQSDMDWSAWASSLNTGLANKVDLDGNNATFPHIIDTYTEGTSGYIVWSNGYCEQWGDINFNGNYTTNVITLFKTYANTDYSIFQSRRRATISTETAVVAAGVTTSTSSFTISLSSSYTWWGWWKTSGYLASGEY
jgi:hypothetical protein